MAKQAASRTRSDGDTGISPGLQEYVNRPDIATLYDGYFRGMGLFDFDTQILDVLFHKPGKLLDLGCGTGRHLLHFAEHGFAVTGVDLSEHMIDVARRKLEQRHLMADFVRSNLCDLCEINDDTFDYVICMFSTLGMIKGRKNRAQALSEAFRVLKPGGMFAAHAHNRFHNLWFADGVLRLMKSYLNALILRGEAGDLTIEGYRGVDKMYLHCYKAREFRSEIRRAGFHPVKLLLLNETRTSLLKNGLLSRFLANGFVALAGKPNRA